MDRLDRVARYLGSPEPRPGGPDIRFKGSEVGKGFVQVVGGLVSRQHVQTGGGGGLQAMPMEDQRLIESVHSAKVPAESRPPRRFSWEKGLYSQPIAENLEAGP